jgi:hypothetical protein
MLATQIAPRTATFLERLVLQAILSSTPPQQLLSIR